MRKCSKGRVSPALVISIAALVLAAAGTSYAQAPVALVAKALGLNGTQKRQVKSIADKEIKGKAPKLSVLFAKSAGTAATAGSAVTATNATNATNAEKATTATTATTAGSAPLPTTLPKGATIRGNYYIDNQAAKAEEFASDSLSFAFPLSAAPTPHVIVMGTTPPPECPGTVTNPQALAGNLCVYEGDALNRKSVNVRDETAGKDGSTDAFGAGIWETSAATGESISGGTWAVTGS